VLGVGEMPADKVTLGCVLCGDDEGLLNGAKVCNATPVVLSEAAELRYNLAPSTPWVAFQVGREVLAACRTVTAN